MIHPPADTLFPPALWDIALEKYASVTHLTVQLFDAEERLVLGPIHRMPLFQLFDETQYDPGIFLECARCCLAQTDNRPAVTVSQVYGLATMGTSLVLDGRIVGALVGGYVFEDFIQPSDIQSLARHSGVAFARLWEVARGQAPVPRRRLLMHGELLQVMGDALLRENHRAQQYKHAAAIIESSDDAIISKDLCGIITSWNGGAERLFGYTTGEAIGEPYTMLVPTDRLEEDQGIIVRITQGESIAPYETVRCRKDGSLVDVSLRASPLPDARGRIVGASQVARDITERRRAQEALHRWNVELEARVVERTRELSTSQDHLRKLAAELNLAEQHERRRLAIELHDHLQQLLVLCKLKLGLGKRLAASLPSCVEMLKATDEVLSDALQYTRTLVAELSPTILHDHGLPAGLRWLGEYMKKYGLAVTVTAPKDEPPLAEDHAVLLFQSVRELLINSFKYAGTGQAAVTLEQRDDQCFIEVSDEGKGFDPAASATPGASSSQFGLFSIRERMKSMGGSFDLKSNVGQGTIVRLSLPLVGSNTGVVREEVLRTSGLETERSMEAATERLMPQSPITQVLLVDDHIMFRQGLRTMLDAYKDVEIVGEAGDGREAVQAVDQFRPGVIVMDINMPTMNGIEATAHIKARHPETIVIGLSVNADGKNQEAMIKAGANVLLSKESAVEKLYQTIYAVAHHHSPTARPSADHA